MLCWVKAVELNDYSRKIYFPLNIITHQSSEMSRVENLTPAALMD